MTDPMRQVHAAARRAANGASDTLRELPDDTHCRATITAVTAGGASDGNALVTVRWRGAELTAADYPDSYTPVVGHRVLCVVVDAELSILHRGIGIP